MASIKYRRLSAPSSGQSRTTASPRASSLPSSQSSTDALLRLLAGKAQHEQSPFVVVHEDVAAGVDGELLAPVDLGRMRAGLRRHVGPLRRHEITDFFRQTRVADVENAQPGIEPGDVDELARLLDRR